MGMLRPLATDRLHDDICTLVDRVARESSGGGDVFFRWVVENELTTSKALEELARQYLVRFEQHCRLLSRGLPRPEFGAPLIIWRARDGFGSALETWGGGGGRTRRAVYGWRPKP